MGRRSGAETVVDVLRAFVERRRWRQAELARRLGITVPSLRKHLVALTTMLPLTNVTEHPDVFWEVPKDWHPEGVVLEGAEVAALVRLLARSPRSAERERLLALLLRRDPRVLAPSKVQARELSPEEGAFLGIVEDAASRRRALRMKYFSARRGDADWRVVSVARVSPGPPSRFFAVCHRSGKLQSFRVGNIAMAQLDASEPFREAAPGDVERRARDGVDGWFEDVAGEVVFVVRSPDARWVERNLEDGMRAEAEGDGAVRVTAGAAGLAAVARFVAGLGAAAVCETPALAAAVRTLAEGALGVEGAKALDGRAVVRIRAKGSLGSPSELKLPRGDLLRAGLHLGFPREPERVETPVATTAFPADVSRVPSGARAS